MKVIIAGSRTINDIKLITKAIEASQFDITEVVCGDAKGVDLLGSSWAHLNDIPVKHFPADWSNIKVKGAQIRENKYGKYNAKAGIMRNEEMAKYAGKNGGLIAIWDGKSTGTANMILTAHRHCLKVFVTIQE